MKKNKVSFTKLFLFLIFTILSLIINIYAQSENRNSEKFQLEKNREKWDSLPQEEKERIVRNYNRWKLLSPEKQKLILERHKFFQTLPQENQLELKEKINTRYPIRPKQSLPKETFKRRDKKIKVPSEKIKNSIHRKELSPSKPMDKKPTERIERPSKIRMSGPRPEKPERPEHPDRHLRK